MFRIYYMVLLIEVLKRAGKDARDKKRNRIVPRHKQLAVRNDEELSKLLGNVTIANAGLEFPVGRITGFLSNRKFDERVNAGAPVCLSAILEYLASEMRYGFCLFPFRTFFIFRIYYMVLLIEVLELAGNEATDKKKNGIAPRHKQLAVKIDEDLSKLLGKVIIANSGVLTNINQCLSPKIANGKDKENGFATEEFYGF
ncbi:histone H2AX-like [Olea europaea subsp. europaea]|uniref:Histone H2A n=1 Tax=Olea europaea subsp. europaea TaxID=158383 RepID=A0A8S0QH05_OLEEU|nr:histone H2AX-like [Olea europaea subsp. europaea]